MNVINELSKYRTNINNQFYSNRVDLLRILNNINKVFITLNKDLNIKFKDPILKINKQFIDVSFSNSKNINYIRFFINSFDISTKNKFIKSCSYLKLKGIIIKEYKIRERSLAFSIDTLTPGLYIWFYNINIMLGGTICSADYNLVIPTDFGFGIVLPNLVYWHTPFKYFKNIKI